MLSCPLLGLRVMQRLHDLHGRHHSSVCGLFLQTSRRRCFCRTLSIFDPLIFFFAFSGDWRDAGARQESSRPPYVSQSGRRCCRKADEARPDYICTFLPYFYYFSDLAACGNLFSNISITPRFQRF